MDTGNNPSENKLLDGSDDYLWDGSGEPDPEIQKLEAMLGKFQSNRPRPVLPGKATVGKWSFFQRIRLVPVLAAVLAIAAIGFVTYTVRGKKTAPVKIARMGCGLDGGNAARRAQHHQAKKADVLASARCSKPIRNRAPPCERTRLARSKSKAIRAFAC